MTVKPGRDHPYDLIIKIIFLQLNEFTGQFAVHHTPVERPPFHIEFIEAGLTFPEPVIFQGIKPGAGFSALPA